MKLLSIAMLLCFGLLGCRDAKFGEITGTWVIDKDSRESWLPVSQQGCAGKLVLEANGLFVASELPEGLLYGPPDLDAGAGVGEGLITGNGSWKLGSQESWKEGWQQVDLTFYKITVGQRGPVPQGTNIFVEKGWSRVNLFYFQRDPDEGRRIVFEMRQR